MPATKINLTEAVRDSIQIEKFIYHIIRQDRNEPDYNDVVTLAADQKSFFEKQIKAASNGTHFIFTDKENNNFSYTCIDILTDVESKFLSQSKILANTFFAAHNRSMSEGVFIIAVVSVLLGNERKNMLSYLKVDFSTVYQQKRIENNGLQEVSLEKVIDSLADNKAAIQKWAVVDPSDLFSWDVIALERGKGGSKMHSEEAISDYFRAFLQVVNKETPSTLTRNSFSVSNKWARSIEDLPDDLPRADFKARSLSYLENNETFDTEGFIEAVLGAYVKDGMSDQEAEARRELRDQHKASLLKALEDESIAGQVFDTRPDSIPKDKKLQTYTTQSGVVIKFKGTEERNNINVKKDGSEHVITIRTTQLEIE